MIPGISLVHIAIVRNKYAGSYLVGSWLRGLTLLTVARPRRILTCFPIPIDADTGFNGTKYAISFMLAQVNSFVNRNIADELQIFCALK